MFRFLYQHTFSAAGLSKQRRGAGSVLLTCSDSRRVNQLVFRPWCLYCSPPSPTDLNSSSWSTWQTAICLRGAALQVRHWIAHWKSTFDECRAASGRMEKIRRVDVKKKKNLSCCQSRRSSADVLLAKYLKSLLISWSEEAGLTHWHRVDLSQKKKASLRKERVIFD